MIQGMAKYVGGKVLTAILVVACALVVIWYWRLDPADREALWSMVSGVLIWLAFVAMLPWALFFVPSLVVKAESNAVSALTLLGYLAVDVAVALLLTGGHWGTSWQTLLMCVGFLAAGVYNFLVCDFLARRAEDAL